MKHATTFAGACLALLCSAQAVAEEVPVIELGAEGNSSQVAPPAANPSQSGQLLLLVQQLQDEVRSLRGQVEQQSYRLKQMEREQLDRYRDLDRRVSSLLAAQSGTGALNPAAPPLPSATDAPADAAPSAPATEPVDAPATSATSAAGDDASAYRQAFTLVRDKSYAAAISAFQAFVRDYPQSPRVANAHYWLGEVHLVQQQPEMAREAFTEVLNRYPKHSKAADAAYKLAVVYDQLGQTERSAQYIDLVLTQYPDSAAARLAQEFKRLQ